MFFFSMIQFGQNFHFFPGLLFSRTFWMEFKRMSMSIKVTNSHRFMHLWYGGCFTKVAQAFV